MSWFSSDPPPPPPSSPLWWKIFVSIFFLSIVTIGYLVYLASQPPKKTKRSLIIDELINTERSYVKTLEELFQLFLDPLTTRPPTLPSPSPSSPSPLSPLSPPSPLSPSIGGSTSSFFSPPLYSSSILSTEESKGIFPASLLILRHTNEEFLSKLEERISPDPSLLPYFKILNLIPSDKFSHLLKSEGKEETKVGDIFVSMAPYFKSYIPYINVFEECKDNLRRLQVSNTRLREFLMVEEHSQHKLEGLMIWPVQRLPRYVLLLAELLKATSPEHPDYKPLEKALESMKETTSTLNFNKKISENHNRVLDIEKQLKIEHQHTRSLVKEGNLSAALNKTKSSSKPCPAYLFNDGFAFKLDKKTQFVPIQTIQKADPCKGGFLLHDYTFGVHYLEPEKEDEVQDWISSIVGAKAELLKNRSSFDVGMKNASDTPELKRTGRVVLNKS